MKNFKSLSEFSKYLGTLVKEEKKYMTAALDVAGQYIEDESKRKFGQYQEAAGPFQAWDELADSTKKQRVRLGFEENNPLYRTGDLMHSVYHTIPKAISVGGFTHMETKIGSDEDIMLWMEEGTVRVPARPVLGPALFQNTKQVKAIIQEGVAAWLSGKPPIKRKPNLG